MTQFQRPATGATLDDLIDAIVKTHECVDSGFDASRRETAALVERHRADAEALIRRHEQESLRRDREMQARMSKAETTLEAINHPDNGIGAQVRLLLTQVLQIKDAMGVSDHTEHKTRAFRKPMMAMSQIRFLWYLMAGMAAMDLTYKIVWAIAPDVWRLLKEVNGVLLK